LDYLVGVRLKCQPSVFYSNSRAYQQARDAAEAAAALGGGGGGKGGKKKKSLLKPSKIVAPDLQPSTEQLFLEMQQSL